MRWQRMRRTRCSSTCSSPTATALRSRRSSQPWAGPQSSSSRPGRQRTTGAGSRRAARVASSRSRSSRRRRSPRSWGDDHYSSQSIAEPEHEGRPGASPTGRRRCGPRRRSARPRRSRLRDASRRGPRSFVDPGRRCARGARTAALASSRMAAGYGELGGPGRGSRVGRLECLVDARLPPRGSVGGATRSPCPRLSGRASVVAPSPDRDLRSVRGDARRSARRRVRRSEHTQRPRFRAAGDRRARRRSNAGDHRDRRLPDRASPRGAAITRPGWAGTTRAGPPARRRGRHRVERGPLPWLGARDGLGRLSPRELRPSGRSLDAVGHRRRDRVVAHAQDRAVRTRRRAAGGSGRHARASRAGARRSDARGCLSTRRRPLRRRDRTTGLTARRNGPDRHRGDRRRQADRRAHPRSGAARRAGSWWSRSEPPPGSCSRTSG